MIKIQSVSDIITNSSSEVFLMSKANAVDIEKRYEKTAGSCITHRSLDLENPSYWDEGSILLRLGADIPGLDSPDFETCDLMLRTWVLNNPDWISKNLPDNPVILDIEDHFDYDEWQHVTSDAMNVSWWRESRH